MSQPTNAAPVFISFIYSSVFHRLREIPKGVTIAANVKKKKSLYFFFCCEKFSKDKWKCNTSSFSETVLVRGNRPWGVCFFTVLWSHESTDLCCYSRLSPDPPQCRQSLIISFHLHATHNAAEMDSVLLFNLKSTSSVDFIAPDMRDTCVQINQNPTLSGMHTAPWERAKILTDSLLCSCEAECWEVFSYVLHH